MKKYKIGYTQGVYDMFHIGHLNMINRAKEYCEYLIVGVNADTLVQSYKNKTPVINEKDRVQIVGNIKAVDQSIIATTLDKKQMMDKLNFDVIFIGDDWKGNPRWEETEIELAKYDVDVLFLPYTSNISSSMLKLEVDKQVEE